MQAVIAVRPFVKSQKNDFNEGTALAEVARLPSMRTVPLRTPDQVDVQAIHRTRKRIVENRNGLANQIRGPFAGSRDCDPARAALRAAIQAILENAQNGLGPQCREVPTCAHDPDGPNAGRSSEAE